jgi:hypothetical protein
VEFGANPQTPKTKTLRVLVPLARAKAFGFRLGSFAPQNSGQLSSGSAVLILRYVDRPTQNMI